LRGLLLRDYVNAIRTSIHEERKQEKRNKINEQLQKYVYYLLFLKLLLLTLLVTLHRIREQKVKLQEARLKALSGEK
jgi:hypothetical protein